MQLTNKNKLIFFFQCFILFVQSHMTHQCQICYDADSKIKCTRCVYRWCTHCNTQLQQCPYCRLKLLKKNSFNPWSWLFYQLSFYISFIVSLFVYCLIKRQLIYLCFGESDQNKNLDAFYILFLIMVDFILGSCCMFAGGVIVNKISTAMYAPINNA